MPPDRRAIYERTARSASAQVAAFLRLETETEKRLRLAKHLQETYGAERVAELVQGWVDEVPLRTLAQRYGVGKGVMARWRLTLGEQVHVYGVRPEIQAILSEDRSNP